MAQIVLWGCGSGGSHLHLPLGQIGSELLGCIEDLPLMPQQGHPEILDVSIGESRCCIRISIRQKRQQKTTIGPQLGCDRANSTTAPPSLIKYLTMINYYLGKLVKFLQ